MRSWPSKTYLSTFLAYFDLLEGPKSMWVSSKGAHGALMTAVWPWMGGQGPIEARIFVKPVPQVLVGHRGVLIEI